MMRRMESLVRTTDMVMIATQNQPHMSDTGPPLLYAMEKEPAQGSITSPFLSAVSHGGAAGRSVRKSAERPGNVKVWRLTSSVCLSRCVGRPLLHVLKDMAPAQSHVTALCKKHGAGPSLHGQIGALTCDSSEDAND